MDTGILIRVIESYKGVMNGADVDANRGDVFWAYGSSLTCSSSFNEASIFRDRSFCDRFWGRATGGHNYARKDGYGASIFHS